MNRTFAVSALNKCIEYKLLAHGSFIYLVLNERAVHISLALGHYRTLKTAFELRQRKIRGLKFGDAVSDV